MSVHTAVQDMWSTIGPDRDTMAYGAGNPPDSQAGLEFVPAEQVCR